ncbi:MAG: hypothetical protein ACQETD_00580 [Pseudomonadota bacterium]
MRALKWLFHPVNLIIVVVVIAIYLNRQMLFPELSESPEVKRITDRVDSVIDSLGSDSKGDEATATAEPAATTSEPAESGDDLPEMRALGEAPTAQAEAQPSREATKPTADAAETGEDSGGNLVAPASLAEASTPTPQVEPAVNGADAAVQPDAPPAPADDAADTDTNANAEAGEPATDPLTLWRSARQAAWQGELALAADRYRSLIERQPENFDAHGELGNVLLHSGEQDAAVAAYAEAALLISRSRQPQVAWRVVEVISHLDPARAQSLYEQIRRQQLEAAKAGNPEQ